MWEVAVVLGFIGTAFIFAYLAMNIDKEHAAIKLLLVCMALLFLVINMSSIGNVLERNYNETNVNFSDSTHTALEGNLDQGYKVMIYSFFLVLFIFVVYFLYKIFIFLSKTAG